MRRLFHFALLLAGAALGVGLLLLTLTAAGAQQTSRASGAAGLKRARLLVILSTRVLNRVNHADARASLKTWFDVIARQQGFLLDSQIDVVDSVAGIRQRLEARTADLMLLDLAGYPELEGSKLITPVVTHARGGNTQHPFVLLANSAGANSLGSLRGSNILLNSETTSETGLAWLEVLLGKAKMGRAATFFGTVKTVDSAQDCILPLFFKKVDACVVDEVNLDIAKELNPQLGQLRVLERSRPMVESVIAMPVEPIPYQKELIDAILALHENAKGRQVLMVLKTDRLVRILPGDLESGRELWRDYGHLQGTPTSGSEVTPAADVHRTAVGKERH